MHMSGKYVNQYNWWHTKKTTAPDPAKCKITAICDDAEPAPCDNCSKETMTLYPIRTGTHIGSPLDKHKYLCKACLKGEQ